MLALLLQFAAVLGEVLVGRPPGRCLWQLPVQLLQTSWESKCA